MINLDLNKKTYGTASETAKSRFSKRHWLLFGGTLLLSSGIMAFVSNDAEAIRDVTEITIPVNGIQEETALSIPDVKTLSTAPITQTVPTPANYSQSDITVRKGDTLAKIFQRQGLSPRDVYDVVSIGDSTSALKRIKPGETLSFLLDEQNKLVELSYKTDITHTLKVTRSGDGLSAHEEIREPELRVAHTTGSIDSSLYMAAQKAGMSDNLIMELANIFGWDVDFALDIRKGDSFTVMYEEKYLDGEKFDDGAIVAASFTNQGRTYEAIRYTDPKGVSNYYTPEGKSMRKAFLRSPVDFRRISSKFQRERYHPVLGKKRPHRGVDYAAATGTPIKASGDGKIIFRGKKGGYGNAIIIQHGSQFTTLYGHMSNFKRGLKNGSYVKQGQVIGFVGMTGVATGPHLHYEFRVNGVHRNPLTVKFPDAEPIKKQYLADFMTKTRPLLAQLDLLSRTTAVAQNDL